eukprot:TRINITY_DN76817_c0_g1_i1.p1 TRINITY_DN76817_c0_g1~~TRINITY_DN76817_c0_g1_i1.p1  ORF type:complete len:459 (-),score=34.15 TRINITY_DN76817_c0_g1_i1:83-1459(-)
MGGRFSNVHDPTDHHLEAAAPPVEWDEFIEGCIVCHQHSTEDTHLNDWLLFQTLQFVRPDTSVWSWGRGDAGQLGMGDDMDRITPREVPALAGKQVVKISAGGKNSIALSEDGTLWSWGQGVRGQLGQAVSPNGDRNYNEAHVTPIPHKVVDISAGSAHNVVATADGTVWTWGGNFAGQLGHGDYEDWETPKQIILPVKKILQIAAGGSYSVAIADDGSLWSWGLGAITGDSGSPTPKKIENFSDGARIAKIAAGNLHCLALDTEGYVWSWGVGTEGQLGHGSTENQTKPKMISAFTPQHGVSHLAAGDTHSLALCADGTVWSWGSGQFGQHGLGHSNVVTTPQPLQSLPPMVEISAGGSHSMALTRDGVLWVWGHRGYGQLSCGWGALSTTKPLEMRSVPWKCGFGTANVVSGLSGGCHHSMVLCQPEYSYLTSHMVQWLPTPPSSGASTPMGQTPD